MGRVSVRPKRVDIEVVRGTRNTFRATFAQADGSAEDLTGATCSITIATAQGKTTKLSKSLTVTDADGGVATLTLTGADLTFAGLPADRPVEWWYEIERTTAAGARNVFFEGRFVLLP